MKEQSEPDLNKEKKKRIRNNWLIAILASMPMIVMLEAYIVSSIFQLISAPDDVQVGVGIILASAFTLLNLLLIRFIINKLKQK